LSEIKIRLGENVLQTLVISEYFATITEEVMSPGLELIDYPNTINKIITMGDGSMDIKEALNKIN